MVRCQLEVLPVGGEVYFAALSKEGFLEDALISGLGELGDDILDVEVLIII